MLHHSGCTAAGSSAERAVNKTMFVSDYMAGMLVFANELNAHGAF